MYKKSIKLTRIIKYLFIEISKPKYYPLNNSLKIIYYQQSIHLSTPTK